MLTLSLHGRSPNLGVRMSHLGAKSLSICVQVLRC